MAIIESTGCDPLWLLTGEGEPFPVIATDDTTRECIDATWTALEDLVAQITHVALALHPVATEEQKKALAYQLEVASSALIRGRLRQ